MSPAVASSAASSQRNSRGGRGSAVWAAGGGGGSTPKGKATTAAASRFWVQTLNRERANELQLRQRSYGLSILQQPEKARLSSFKDSSDTSDRRPVDPPIILQVHSTNPARDYPDEFLESVSFFTRAHLVAVNPVESGLVKKADVPAEVMHAGGDWWKRVKGPKGGEPLAGEELVGGEKMADPEGKMGVFFIFSKLSIRVPGKYRLLFSLYEITGPVVRKKAAIVSEIFEVFSPKLFTGMTASTPLTKHFARQGVKVKIRGTGPLTASALRGQSESAFGSKRPPVLPPSSSATGTISGSGISEPYGSSSSSGASRTRKAEDDLRGSTEHHPWSGIDQSSVPSGGWRGASDQAGLTAAGSIGSHPNPPINSDRSDSYPQSTVYYSAQQRTFDTEPPGPSLPHLDQVSPYLPRSAPEPSTAPPGPSNWSNAINEGPDRGTAPPSSISQHAHSRAVTYPYDASVAAHPTLGAHSPSYPSSRHNWGASYVPPPLRSAQSYEHPSRANNQHVDLTVSTGTTTGTPWQQETTGYLSPEPAARHLSNALDPGGSSHWSQSSTYPLQPPSSPPSMSFSGVPPPFAFSSATGAYRDAHLGRQYAESTASVLTSPSTAHSTPPVANPGYLSEPPSQSRSAAVEDYRFYELSVGRPQLQPQHQRQHHQHQPQLEHHHQTPQHPHQRGELASTGGQRAAQDSFGYSYRPAIYRESGDPWDRVLQPNFAHDPAFLGAFQADLTSAIPPFPRHRSPNGGNNTGDLPLPTFGYSGSASLASSQQHQQQQHQHQSPRPQQQQQQLRPNDYSYALSPPNIPSALDPGLDGSQSASSPSHG